METGDKEVEGERGRGRSVADGGDEPEEDDGENEGEREDGDCVEPSGPALAESGPVWAGCAALGAGGTEVEALE